MGRTYTLQETLDIFTEIRSEKYRSDIHYRQEPSMGGRYIHHHDRGEYAECVDKKWQTVLNEANLYDVKELSILKAHWDSLNIEISSFLVEPY